MEKIKKKTVKRVSKKIKSIPLDGLKNSEIKKITNKPLIPKKPMGLSKKETLLIENLINPETGLIRKDMRAELFREYFSNPDSPFFDNGLKSALAAGYPYNTAKQITAPELQGRWIESLRSNGRLISKSRRNIEEFLDLNVEIPITVQGSTVMDDFGKILTKKDSRLLSIKKDVTLFVAKAMDKDFKDAKIDSKEDSNGDTTNITFNFYPPSEDSERKNVDNTLDIKMIEPDNE